LLKSRIVLALPANELKLWRARDAGLKAYFAHTAPVLCKIMGREVQGYIELGQARITQDRRYVLRQLEGQEQFLLRDLLLR
jgi:hypothetical protein